MGTRRFVLSMALSALCACSSPQTKNSAASVHDLYIHGGTIVDGTGTPQFAGDLLIDDGMITFVGTTDPDIVAAVQTIDASGKVVSPGFIDAHAHGSPLSDDNDFLKSFLRQGVTTVILGQDGASPDRRKTIAEWLEAVKAKGVGPNVAALVGHGTLRTQSGGGEKEQVTPQEQTAMETLLAQGFEDGAYGLSTGLEYLPGRYANKAELNALAKVAGAHDGIVSSHIRNEDDDRVAQSVAEVIEQGQYARVNVTHIKVVYGKSRAQGEAVLKQIRDARDSGMQVTADVYPYLASFGSLIYLYPEWAKRKTEFDNAVINRRAELEDFLRAKIRRRNGPDAILISKGEYAGKTLGEIAAINGVSPEEARRARAYGYVFQAAGLYPWRTIGKNVSLPLEIMGFSKAEQQERVAQTRGATLGGGALAAVAALVLALEAAVGVAAVFDVVGGIDVTVDVGDIVVCETPCHLADGVGFTNVREELVAHPLTFASAFDDSGDVDEGHRRRNGLSGMKHLRQHIEALVRHPDHANIRLNGREGVVRRQDVILGQRVEQGGFAHVGQTHYSHFKTHVSLRSECRAAHRWAARQAQAPDRTIDVVGATVFVPLNLSGRTRTEVPIAYLSKNLALRFEILRCQKRSSRDHQSAAHPVHDAK